MIRALKFGVFVCIACLAGCGGDSKEKLPEVQKSDTPGKEEKAPTPTGTKAGGAEPVRNMKPD